MEGKEERRLVILYGSQTGTAEDVAHRLARQAHRRHFVTRTMSLDSYNVADLVNEKATIFVCSTTGQGDTPDNMMTFWRFIMRRHLLKDSLCQLWHAVLGLGDSSYLKFNFVAKKLDKRLEQLGSSRLTSIGLADDQHDLGADGVVYPWMDTLFDVLLSRFPLPPGLQIIPKHVRPPARYRVEFISTNGAPASKQQEHESNVPSNDSSVNESSLPNWFPGSPIAARLISNERVTAEDHFQDTRLIRLDISGSNLSYDPGDVAVICPQNASDTVEMFIQHMGLDAQQLFLLHSTEQGTSAPQMPEPCSVKYLVTNYLDINCVPKKSFFEMMLYFATDDLEQEKLEEFTSAEGQDDLFTYCNRVKRTLLEVLQDFPHTSANLPFEYLFDIIPTLQPRQFSIASSLKLHPGEIQLLVAVVTFKTRIQASRRGVCSTWLANLDPSHNPIVPVSVKKGTIKFPTDVSTPVIMVGPGTGVAPFRSFIEDRVAQGMEGDLVLVFGCRHSKKDFYFMPQWKTYTEKDSFQLLTAFSREKPDENRYYVQHALIDNAKDIWSRLRNGACFCVAGNAKNMPDAVRDSVKEILQSKAGLTDTQASQYLADMDKQKRYQAETWS